MTLSHPDLWDLTFNPEEDSQKFLEWVRPIMPRHRARSTAILQVPGVNMTDSGTPSLSLMSLSSNAAVAEALGTPDLSMHRWRGNIHFDGAPAWAEFEWVGKTLQIGSAEFRVRKPVERCNATTVDPETGEKDYDMLTTLNAQFGHQNFGVTIVVTKAGEIAVGDTIRVL